MSKIEIPCDDFNGEFCTTGVDCQLAVASHLGDFPKKSELLYYVKSLPGTFGLVSWDSHLVVPFQMACDEWQKCTGIKFIRTDRQNLADFIIRTANADEESERHNLIAESFFWSSKEKKVLKVWKRINQWNAYSVYLHEIGHILGFRHEHVFLSQEERAFIGVKDESSHTYTLLQEVVDKSSIMSYGYLQNFTDASGMIATLSDTDKEQAKRCFVTYNQFTK